MKKAIAIIVTMLFVFAIASIAIAAEEKKAVAPVEKKAVAPVEKKAEEKKAEKKVAPKQFTGEVKAIDKEKKTIAVTKKAKDKAIEEVFAFDDKTTVKIGKDKKTVADLKVGDKAMVKFEEKDGKKIAKSITVAPEKKVEKKEMKKEEKPAPEKKPMEPMKPAEPPKWNPPP